MSRFIIYYNALTIITVYSTLISWNLILAVFAAPAKMTQWKIPTYAPRLSLFQLRLNIACCVDFTEIATELLRTYGMWTRSLCFWMRTCVNNFREPVALSHYFPCNTRCSNAAEINCTQALINAGEAFLEAVFSPYISVDGDAMKSRFSIFWLYTRDRHGRPLIVWRWRVRRYITAGGIRFTLNDRKGKQSLVVTIEIRSWLALVSITSFICLVAYVRSRHCASFGVIFVRHAVCGWRMRER